MCNQNANRVRNAAACTEVCLTYSFLEVSVTYQFEVLFHSLCSKCVFSKDQMFTVQESIHLTHGHVRQELLRNEERLYVQGSRAYATIGYSHCYYTDSEILPWFSLCFEGCAPGQKPPPLCSSRSRGALEPHTVFGSCW